MSTIKSSAENLTLNADGANNDIIFQSNGSNVATLDQAGLLTATTFAGSGANLTGLPNGSQLVHSGTTQVETTATGAKIGSTSSTQTHLDITTNTASYGGVYFTDGADEAYRGAVQYKHGDDFMHMYTAGTERMRIHSNGVTSIPAGVALGVGTANTASNVLDDYEEGTWTPQMDSDYTSVGYDGDNGGTYTKIGNLVTVNFRVDVNSWSGSSSGYATVCNLPFTVATDSTFTAANPSWHYSMGEFPGTGYCNSNTTEIVWLRNHTGGDRYHLTGDQMWGSSGDARLSGSATYRTTA